MDELIEIKAAWEEFYAKIQGYLMRLEANLTEREDSLDRKLAESKLIGLKAKELEDKISAFAFEKDLITKQQAALREKQLLLDNLEKKLEAKAQRLQTLLAE